MSTTGVNYAHIGSGSQQRSIQGCVQWLRTQGLPIKGPPEEEGQWCGATFDGLMCWSAVRNGSKAEAYCPDVPGLDTTKILTKGCHSSGRWRGVNDTDFSKATGYTPFVQDCLLIPRSVMKDAKLLASRARKLEFVGLTCSFCALVAAVCIFSCFRRLRVFRTQLHLNLMVALLIVVCVRLALYLDQGLDTRPASAMNGTRGLFIHPTLVLCETSYVLLEYCKSVTFAWMFLEGFYLWNSIVMTVFSSKEPKIWKYMAAGWGGSLVQTLIWLVAVVSNPKGVNGCLRNYFLQNTFWILDGPRMLGLLVSSSYIFSQLNTVFIISVIWVLWMKVKGTSASSEVTRMRKSVKAAFMLIPLLGIPNVTQLIPFKPTEEHFTVFAVYTYVASFFYMFQGFMIAIIYCFTNREVMNVLTANYARYKLNRSTAHELRRSSRLHSQKSHGKMMMNGHRNTDSEYPNDNDSRQPASVGGLMLRADAKNQSTPSNMMGDGCRSPSERLLLRRNHDDRQTQRQISSPTYAHSPEPPAYDDALRAGEPDGLHIDLNLNDIGPAKRLLLDPDAAADELEMIDQSARES